MDLEQAYWYYLDMMIQNNQRENLGLTEQQIEQQWSYYYQCWINSGIIKLKSLLV